LAILISTSILTFAQRQPAAEQRVSRYFESIRNEPLLLGVFLRQMPKGGDLHNHLSGAVYAESYIQWAAQDGLCVDRKNLAFVAPPCDAEQKVAASNALKDASLYYALIDAFSMRGRSLESGHDHFFASFAKFGAATYNRQGDMLAEVVSRAADENELYVELMGTPENAAALGKKAGWDNNFDRLRERILNNGMKELVASVIKSTDESEEKMRALMQCGSPQAQSGCGVQVRYISQGIRNAAPEQVFAQLLGGFELAKADPRFVGLTLVSPEDSFVSMRDFDLHMRMFDYLHSKYPKVGVSLHAGELAPQLVPPEGLRDHVRKSIEIGRAERIGHGVDVMYEQKSVELLKEMAARKILVEICLTSNDGILGIRGAQHPLPLYLRYGVPVTLATDDEGVSRSTLSHEYQRATETYGLKYTDLKKMARMSMEHSFLPGESIWSDIQQERVVPSCATDRWGSDKTSENCSAFLKQNERGRMQWKLEDQFAKFESQY
jgi:adenosine deaminase